MAREPRIVAELGRPETPEETAARKAETSRVHRENQTTVNLIGALVVCLAVVLVLVLVVVRPDPAPRADVDYATIASELGAPLADEVVVPDVAEGWVANAASVRTTDGVTSWYIGFVVPGDQFVALVQGFDANPTWLADTVERGTVTATVEIGGLLWDVYDRRDEKDTGNHAYALVATVGDDTIVLHGTAGDTEFATLATAVAAELEK